MANFSVTPTSGKGGTEPTSLTVKATANTARARRKGTLTLASTAGASVTVPLVQYGTPVMNAVSSEQISASGGAFTFRVWSDYPYTLSVSGDASASWTGSQSATGEDWREHSVTFVENTSTSSRTATVTMAYTSLAGKSVSVGSLTVTQAAAASSTVTETSWSDMTVKLVSGDNAAASGGTATFSATVTVGYSDGTTGTKDVTSQATWSTSSTELASVSGGVLTWNENTSTSSRTVTVYANVQNPYGTGSTNYLFGESTATQDGAAGIVTEDPYLRIKPSNQSLTANGGEGDIDVTSNVSWTASSDSAWLSIGTGSGTGDGTVHWTAEASRETSERSGSVTVSATDGSGLSRTFTVTEAAYEEVTVEEPSFTSPTPDNAIGRGDTKYIGIKAADGVSWSVSSGTLGASPSSGTGSATVTLTYPENKTTSVIYHTVTLYNASGTQVDSISLPQDISLYTFTLESVSPSSATVTVNGTAATKGYTHDFQNGSKITVEASANGYKSSSTEYTMGTDGISASVSLEKEYRQVGVSYSDTIGPEGGTVSVDIDTSDCTDTTTYTVAVTSGNASLSQSGLDGWAIEIGAYDNGSNPRIITFRVTTTDGSQSAYTDYTITQTIS